MIEGVKVVGRRIIVDERGKIMHMLKRSDEEFRGFGEVYFSWVNPGAVKAWHLHSRMTLNYACPHGLVKIALYDDRPASQTRGELMELFLGPESYSLVQIPPGIWNGFKGVAPFPSMICNCASHEHDPGEIQRVSPVESCIAYDWALKNG